MSTNEILGQKTGLNIARKIYNILNKWEIMDKVVTIVSDNGSNIKSAINDHLKKYHHPCVAHTLNLYVGDSIKANDKFISILKKCRALVFYFKMCTPSEKLKNTQEQMGFPVLKVKEDVSTRWNSSLKMFERLIEIKNAITVTLTSLPKAPNNLDGTDWSIILDCIPVLKPIETLTIVLSAEKYPTISMIIPLIRGLQHTLKHVNTITEVGTKLRHALLDVIGRRLAPLEQNKIVSKASFLDPRFKTLGFGTEENAKNAELLVTTEVQGLVNRNNANNSISINPTEELKKISDPSNDVWAYFDNKSSEKKQSLHHQPQRS